MSNSDGAAAHNLNFSVTAIVELYNVLQNSRPFGAVLNEAPLAARGVASNLLR